MSDILKVDSISQFHKLLKLPAPDHPLITFIYDEDLVKDWLDESMYGIRFSSSMYTIMYKDKISGSLGYGRNSYDYEEGTMIFAHPHQVFTVPTKEELRKKDGWTLLFHPDLIIKSNLFNQMDSYTFFDYEVTEALHLSKKEEEFIQHIADQIKTEYSQNIDKHSQNLILSNLELFLNYCMRFYDRQFYTRTSYNFV